MQENKYLLLIDQGGHSSRAILFDNQGRQLASAFADIQTEYKANGHIEADTIVLEQSLDCILAEIASKAEKLGIAHIDCAAVIAQRSSFIACCKQTGKTLTPVISWMDTRNAAWFDNHRQHFPAIQSVSGLYPNAHYAASKMLWLLQNDATVKNACENHALIFYPLAAYIARYLCKEKHMPVDAVIASRTMLADYRHNIWSDELLDIFQIPRHCLPEIVASRHDFGHIYAGRYKMPLVMTGGDQSFVAFSNGMDAYSHAAFINAGSGAFVLSVCDHLSEQTRLLKSPLVAEENHTVIAMEGTVNAAASALDWLYNNQGKLDYSQLEKALSSQTDIPLFINTVAGTGSPWWLEVSTPFFNRKSTLEANAVAVLESIVFMLKDNLAEIVGQNPSVERIIVSGGLSLSNGFCQRLCNIAELDVYRTEDTEASTRGLAFYLFNINKEKSGLTYRRFTPEKDEALSRRYQLHRQLMEDACRKRHSSRQQ